MKRNKTETIEGKIIKIITPRDEDKYWISNPYKRMDYEKHKNDIIVVIEVSKMPKFRPYLDYIKKRIWLWKNKNIHYRYEIGIKKDNHKVGDFVKFEIERIQSDWYKLWDEKC